MKRNADRMQLDRQRCEAARYFCENYSREKRYLIIFERDFDKWLKSSEKLRERETDKQYYWDFLGDFENLKAKMAEFRWTTEKLLEYGIDFKAIRKLYFAVA